MVEANNHCSPLRFFLKKGYSALGPQRTTINKSLHCKTLILPTFITQSQTTPSFLSNPITAEFRLHFYHPHRNPSRKQNLEPFLVRLATVLPRPMSYQPSPRRPHSTSSRTVQPPPYAPPPVTTSANDSQAKVKQLEALLQEKIDELDALKAKAVNFQNRLDRVSKLLPLPENK